MRMTALTRKVQQVLCILLPFALQLCSAQTEQGGLTHTRTRTQTHALYLSAFTRWHFRQISSNTWIRAVHCALVYGNTCPAAHTQQQNLFSTRKTCLPWVTYTSPTTPLGLNRVCLHYFKVLWQRCPTFQSLLTGNHSQPKRDFYYNGKLNLSCWILLSHYKVSGGKILRKISNATV